MIEQKSAVIVDTNILFSALLREKSRFGELLIDSNYQFFICEQVLVELFRRKEKILKASQLREEEIVTIYQILLKRLNLYKEDLIATENLAAAYELCRDIDETDTPHVALTIELGGLLWTGDKRLKDGLQSKGFIQLFELNN